MEGGRIDEPVAHVELADRALRPVFESADGRQFVIGDDGRLVYGVWFIPREEFDTPFMFDEREF